MYNGTEDERSRKIFIGGLHVDANEEHLRSFYGSYGQLVDVIVMRDGPRSRGFGFVTYSDSCMVDGALNTIPHVILGKQVEAKRALPRASVNNEGGFETRRESYHNADNPKDTEQFRKLFVGGLNPETTEDDMATFFGVWGQLVDVVVMRENGKEGRSRRFGFVTYKDAESVDSAQQSRPHIINGKEVESKRAMPKGDSHKPEYQVKSTKIFIGGLRRGLTNEDLKAYFSTFGTITDSVLMIDKETGNSRGFGFVTFSDSDTADKATLFKPHVIGDSKCEVKKAVSKDQMQTFRGKEMNMGGGNSYGLSQNGSQKTMAPDMGGYMGGFRESGGQQQSGYYGGMQYMQSMGQMTAPIQSNNGAGTGFGGGQHQSYGENYGNSQAASMNRMPSMDGMNQQYGSQSTFGRYEQQNYLTGPDRSQGAMRQKPYGVGRY